MYTLFKINPVMKIMSSSLRDLPSPSSIHSMWNFGSLLGTCLLVQIISGVFLALHFSADTSLSFNMVSHMGRDVSLGWLIRAVHANGASIFFMCLYLHMSRGIYFNSFFLVHTWFSGIVILVLTMATAFLGYVLPWGQMSFWGATVITNLFSAIPYMGHDIVYWLWGGFAVENATLTRFFAFHFLVPFLILGSVCVHLLFLHQSGSSNPLGVSLNLDKVPFHPYFSYKDILGVCLVLTILLALVLESPWLLGDPENFIPANPLVTPVHIQPEWYFLFAYAILRAIPSKLGGVVALGGSIVIFSVLPLSIKEGMLSNKFNPGMKTNIWIFFMVVLLLTWVGARPVSVPFIMISQILTIIYFGFFLTFPIMKFISEKLCFYH